MPAQALLVQNGGIKMTDEPVKVFVDRYLPGYELWMKERSQDGNVCATLEGRGSSLDYDAGREGVRICQLIHLTTHLV
jgi:hypothetical protein